MPIRYNPYGIVNFLFKTTPFLILPILLLPAKSSGELWIKHGHERQDIRDVREARAVGGEIWFATRSGLFFSTSDAAPVKVLRALDEEGTRIGAEITAFNCLAEFGDEILIGTEGGLFFIDDGGYRRWPKYPAHNLEILTIFVDGDTGDGVRHELSSLWIGTSRGLFNGTSENPQIPNALIHFISAYSGGLLVGTSGKIDWIPRESGRRPKGLDDPKLKGVTKYVSLGPFLYLLAVGQLAEGGTLSGKYLLRLDPRTGTVEQVDRNVTFMNILPLPSGKELWYSTDSGEHLFVKERLQRAQSNGRLEGRRATAYGLVADRIWHLGPKGVFYQDLDGGAWLKLASPPLAINGSIDHFFETAQGAWFAGSEGIFQYYDKGDLRLGFNTEIDGGDLVIFSSYVEPWAKYDPLPPSDMFDTRFEGAMAGSKEELEQLIYSEEGLEEIESLKLKIEPGEKSPVYLFGRDRFGNEEYYDEVVTSRAQHNFWWMPPSALILAVLFFTIVPGSRKRVLCVFIGLLHYSTLRHPVIIFRFFFSMKAVQFIIRNIYCRQVEIGYCSTDSNVRGETWLASMAARIKGAFRSVERRLNLDSAVREFLQSLREGEAAYASDFGFNLRDLEYLIAAERRPKPWKSAVESLRFSTWLPVRINCSSSAMKKRSELAEEIKKDVLKGIESRLDCATTEFCEMVIRYCDLVVLASVPSTNDNEPDWTAVLKELKHGSEDKIYLILDSGAQTSS